MAFYRDNLATMIGRVRDVKQNAQPGQIARWINDRIREVIDSRPFWTDLMQRGVWNFPNQYSTGTIWTTTGSSLITGVSTAWPINDVINTTLSAAVSQTGIFDATPASMTGIKPGMFLLLNAGGGNQEAVAVRLVTGSTFTAKFQNTHSAAETVQCSSLAGQQFQAMNNTPVMTIRSVRSATSLEVDQPWAGAAVASSAKQSYQIIQRYVTPGPDLKRILAVVDPTQGIPLFFDIKYTFLETMDPQRTSYNSPQMVVDLGPDESGNMQYEVWPPPTSQYALRYLYAKGWPDLVSMNDQPPPFINPVLFTDGAIATALRSRIAEKDPWFNPVLAKDFDAKYKDGWTLAINQDEAKATHDYEREYDSLFQSFSYDYWQSHVDVAGVGWG